MRDYDSHIDVLRLTKATKQIYRKKVQVKKIGYEEVILTILLYANFDCNTDCYKI